MLRSIASLAAVALAALAAAQPLDTAFTFQGELLDGGAPAGGAYDLRFRLYDSATGGTQQGAELCSDNIDAVDGRFTVSLDFGPQFNGQQRFLEIDVRADTGLACANPNGFFILSPRQPLSAAPNAVFSINATTAADAAQLNGQPSSFFTNAANLTGTLPSARLAGAYSSPVNISNPANIFSGSGAGLTNLNAAALSSGTIADARLPTNFPRLDSPNAFGNFTNSFMGRVGIGTASPLAPLHISTGIVEPAPGEGIRVTGTAAGNTNVSYISFGTTAGQAIGYIGDGSTTDSDMYLTAYVGDVYLYTPWGAVVSATADGNVGIGTVSPLAKLDVRGFIRLGASGEFFAVKSPANDRVIRGQVNFNGTIDAARSTPGFTVTHSGTGTYVINFTVPFSSPPTVVATGMAICCRARLSQTQTTFATIFALDNGTNAQTDSPFQFIAIGPN